MTPTGAEQRKAAGLFFLSFFHAAHHQPPLPPPHRTTPASQSTPARQGTARGSRQQQHAGLALASGGGRAEEPSQGEGQGRGRREERSASSSSSVKSGTHMAGWRGESASWEPPRRCRGTGQGSEGTAGIREARGGWWTGIGARIPVPEKGWPSMVHRHRVLWLARWRWRTRGEPARGYSYSTAVQRRRVPWKRAHVLTRRGRGVAEHALRHPRLP